MGKLIHKIFLKDSQLVKNWAEEHFLGLFVFNIVAIILLLLRSAGYFDPFFPLTINFIIFICFIMAIFLLGAGSRTLFVIALIFWIFAAILRVFQIEVWAERTVIYSFQALILGILILPFENRKDKSSKNN